MGFNEDQERKLKSKLQKRHIKTREANGKTLSYVNGWHVVSQANNIFGYDAWDRQTREPSIMWSDRRHGKLTCMYSAKVRITVRAGDNVIVREGIGTGTGHNETDDLAHEIAIKAAETDATKRALATFGNPFGLELYDHRSRTKPTTLQTDTIQHNITLVLPDTTKKTVKGQEDFCKILNENINQLKTINELYEFWEANLSALTALPNGTDKPLGQDLSNALKKRAEDIRQLQTKSIEKQTARKRTFPLPKERRIRDKTHLKFVARHPCLICGRQPTQAHHIKFAQPRAMALKVSDEFTVPLCNTHHDQLHRSGNEKFWWSQNKIDPLNIAEQLWKSEDKSDTTTIHYVQVNE